MATFDKRISSSTGVVSWRARIRRDSGPGLTKTFLRRGDAEQWARAIEAKLDGGDVVASADARRRTIGDAIDKYITEILPTAKHRKAADTKLIHLRWWRTAIGHVPLLGLQPATITEARALLFKRRGLKGGNLSGQSVNRYMTSLSVVFDAVRRDFGWGLDRNPAAGMRRFAEPRGRERFLSDDERTALLRACDGSECRELGVIVRLALFTGARQGEVLTLDWSNVDFKRQTVRFVDTKNGESRTLPLAAPAVKLLRDWRGDRIATGPVFPERTHKNLLRWSWLGAINAAGLTDFRFHDLRHSTASYLTMSGATPREVAEVLGHKTLVMAMRYSHLSQPHTASVIDRMARAFPVAVRGQ